MYVPSQFEETRVPALHAAIRAAGLATIVTDGPGGLEANHLPVLLDAGRGPLGTLVGHVAKANRVWQGCPDGRRALAVFLGPDAYVTPSWYPTKGRTGEVVPTWNYVAVHAHGALRFFEDERRLLALVTALTERHEAGRAERWAVTDAPEPYVRAMLRGIVGFELAVERLEGKWKMSQNRSADDRAGVAEGLAREGRAEVAALVAGVSGPEENER